ncbi:Uncharacterised protein [Mycoplasmopsis maculosa]|uniref:DUF304 domain-containing protein n=1 Tax=Mycoplasmopsis maculosa TaxID=114885 RepID=A0A449B3W3_9BACT|nr:hypothetical protein [Mycoplasmopsis maculosa]VEU75291.1 Uncharacterised protein [Mycoplasmopsis maculosa]
MHEIRKDSSEEKEILRIEFIPKTWYLVIAILSFIISLLTIGLIIWMKNYLFNSGGMTIFNVVFLSSAVIFEIIVGILFILWYLKSKKQKVVITNKKIKGSIYTNSKSKKFIGFSSLFNFSMRIDQIDEIHSNGSNLHLTFVSGSNNSKEKELTLFRVKNIQTVQEKLEELMSESKNSTDLQFEIEAKKLDLEREKIEALKNLKN